jgi:hypothetical protein
LFILVDKGIFVSIHVGDVIDRRFSMEKLLRLKSHNMWNFKCQEISRQQKLENEII